MRAVTVEELCRFCTITGEDSTTARSYLESEEGSLSGAIAAYEADNAYLGNLKLQRGDLEGQK
jgi:hypothetical protein